MAESPHPDRLHHDALRQELEAVQRRRDSYQALLKDLPEIFEGKFRERLRPLQQRNEQLQLEGLALREQIRKALPAAGAAPSPAATPIASQVASQASEALEAPAEVPEPLAVNTHAADPPLLWEPTAHEPRPRRSASASRPRGLKPVAERLGGLELQRTHAALAGGFGLALAAVALGASLRQPARIPAGAVPPTGPETAQRSDGTRPAPGASWLAAVDPWRWPGADSKAAANAMLKLRATDTSWVEAEDLQGRTLFYGMLSSAQQLPLQGGLRIRAGRPEHVWIRIGDAAERPLENRMDWQIIEPPPAR